MLGAVIVLLNVVVAAVIVSLFRRGSWLALLPVLGASAQLIHPGILSAAVMAAVAALAVSLWWGRGGAAIVKAAGGGWKGFVCTPAPESKDDASAAYSPVSAGGLHVTGTIIGLSGLILATVGTLIGVGIWFDLDLSDSIESWDKAEDLFDGRFFVGLSVVIFSNLLGLAILAMGKFNHFMHEMLVIQRQQVELLRAAGTRTPAPVPPADPAPAATQAAPSATTSEV